MPGNYYRFETKKNSEGPKMKRLTRMSCCLLCLAITGLWLCEDALAQRGRGGGGGRSVGGGGGGRSFGGGGMSHSRPSAGRSPSMNRPSGGGYRPSTGNRPGVGSRPAPGQRPSPAPGNRPEFGNRPAPGQRPTQGQLNDFLDVGARPSRPVGGPGDGGAAGDFLRDRMQDAGYRMCGTR